MSVSEAKRKGLTGKKILFFSPAFFGYEDKIKNKMLELGAEVDSYDVRSVVSAFERAVLKMNQNIFKRRTEKYYAKILSGIKTKKYDYVFFIKCDMPTERILKIYRKCFKNAKFCLHMWDSIENIPGIENKFKYFDFISSFDRLDCETYPELHFRPLYFCDEYRREEKRTEEYDYDLCFIGTIHSDRWKILKELKRQSEEKNLRIFYYPYLQSKFIYYFYRFIKPEFWDSTIDEFYFEKLSGDMISKKVDKSKIVIDIQHPRQNGLTIRTIEMIGMNKKMITTNQDIRNYDFYNPENICILNRRKPALNMNFKSDYMTLDKALYNKYSLESWIYEVLGNEK